VGDDLVGGAGVVALAQIAVPERGAGEHVDRPGAGPVGLAAGGSVPRRQQLRRAAIRPGRSTATRFLDTLARSPPDVVGFVQHHLDDVELAWTLAHHTNSGWPIAARGHRWPMPTRRSIRSGCLRSCAGLFWPACATSSTPPPSRDLRSMFSAWTFMRDCASGVRRRAGAPLCARGSG
jgi:hypothetical protein